MNGTQLDQSIDAVYTILLALERDTEKSCLSIKGNILQTFTEEARSYYETDILELYDRIKNQLFDNKTIEIASKLLNVFLDEYKLRLKELNSEYSEALTKKIEEYKIYKTRFLYIFRTLQTIIILGATSLPFVINISELPKLVPTVISIIVAVALAFTTSYKFGDRARYFQQAEEKMQQEYNLYKYSRKHYSDLEKGAALDLLMDKIDEISQEQHEISLKIEETEQRQQKELGTIVSTYKK